MPKRKLLTTVTLTLEVAEGLDPAEDQAILATFTSFVRDLPRGLRFSFVSADRLDPTVHVDFGGGRKAPVGIDPRRRYLLPNGGA